MVGLDRAHMTVRGQRIACWKPKAIDIHSQYLILTALARQQWLDERGLNITS